MKRILLSCMSAILILLLATHGVCEITLNVYGKGGAGEWDNPIFKTEHPEISWQGGDILAHGADDLVQSLTARQPYDIYALNYTEQNFTQIVQKGFAADLSGYAVLADTAARLRPYLQDALRWDDNLYGVPIQLTAPMWAYSPESFARAGLSEADVPQTYIQFLDLLAGWIAEEPDTDIQFLRGASDVRAELAHIITKELIARYDASDKPESFCSPQIAEIYEKLDDLDTTKLDQFLASLEEGDGYDHPALFTLSFDGLEVRSYEETAGFIPFSLRVTQTERIRVPVEMRLFFIGSDSENPDAAALYLEAYLRGLDESFSIVSQSGPHAPLENPRVLAQLKQLLQEQADLETALKEPGTDATAISQQLENNRLRMEKAQTRRMLVPQESIDRLDRWESAFYVPSYSPLGCVTSDSYRSIQTLIDRYAARQINSTTFLRSLDKKAATPHQLPLPPHS